MKRTGFKARTTALKRRRKPPTKHERFVAKLPCAITGTPYGVDVHHILRSGEHGTGKRSSERWAIPLCRNMHRELHDDGNETRFLESYGIDGPALAKALYEATGDYERACAILRGLQAAE